MRVPARPIFAESAAGFFEVYLSGGIYEAHGEERFLRAAPPVTRGSLAGIKNGLFRAKSINSLTQVSAPENFTGYFSVPRKL